MRLLTTTADLAAWRAAEPLRPVLFVPTMGALHQGHARLLQRAAEMATEVVPDVSSVGGSGDVDGQRRPRLLISVFVNPLQFAPGEDFARYPRQLEQDAALASDAGADALFAPAVEDLYPAGEDGLTRVLPPPELLRSLCARSRPGHFDGVATVVCRLLGLIRPQRLVMGEKDWQQLQILRRVVADLGLPVVVQGCATVRETDGLACSSRNRYLSAEERCRAAALPAALAAAASAHAAGETDAASLCALSRQRLEAAGLELDYLELVQPHTLHPVSRVTGLSLLAAAVHCGPSRLIDHLFLMSRSPIVAIDGPAGAGKSTVTQAFARRLGLIYLDTGAMYRALTWWVQHNGVDPADAEAVEPLLAGLDLQLSSAAGGSQRVTINGHEVSTAIRSPEVTAQVSLVAAHACVRRALTEQQQVMGRRGGLVAEGRDIGTAVFPDAECKVFLTATVAERARRRAADLAARGFPVPPLPELEAQIAERDRLDSSRAVAPLCQAEDAVELVTDGMPIEAVIQALVDLFRARVPEEAWPEPPLSLG